MKAIVTAMLVSLLLSAKPSLAEDIWPDYDISGVRLGMSCVEAIQRLRSAGYEPTGQQPGSIGTLSQYVAVAEGHHSPPSIVDTPAESFWALGNLEAIKLWCEARPFGAAVYMMEYDIRGISVSPQEVTSTLQHKFGPPTTAKDGYLDSAASEMIWSPDPDPEDGVEVKNTSMRWTNDPRQGLQRIDMKISDADREAHRHEMITAIRQTAQAGADRPHF